MILKNKYDTLTFDEPKIIIALDQFVLLKQLLETNPKSLLITPLTKITEIYDLKVNAPLFKYLAKYLDQSLINEEVVLATERMINAQLGKVLTSTTSDPKLVKGIFEVEDQCISLHILEQFLKNLGELNVVVPIIIVGFDHEVKKLLKTAGSYQQLFFVSDDCPRLKLTRDYFEILVFETDYGFVEVNDYPLFKSYVESLVNKPVTDQEINNYFSGENADFMSYLLAKSLKKLK